MMILCPVIILNIASLYIKNKLKTNAMTAYFILLMFSINTLYFAALVNLLKPAAIWVYTILGSLIIYGFVKNKNNQNRLKEKDEDSIYLLLHNLSCVVFSIIFYIKKPALYYWDELNIWGPSAKVVKLFDRLYSIGINPSTNDRNYPAGNALLNYFYSFFDADFKEYVLLLSYAFLFFACFAFVASVVYKLTKNHTIAIGTYFVFLLSPFMAANHLPSKDYSSLSYAYGTSMVDFNLAVVFIGVLALYFGERNRKWFLLPLIYLITIKKNGIFFALLAVCIIGCYEFFTFKIKGWKLKKAIITCVSALAVVLVSYGAWTVHLDHYELPVQKQIFNLKDTASIKEIDNERTNKQTGEISNQTQNKRVKPNQTSVKAIFVSALRTERYREILNEMSWYFMNNYETIFMKDFLLIIILFILGSFTAFYQEKGKKLAVFFISLGLTAGCFVYNLVIAYQMQFYNDMMVEYPRYMLSYYFGWIFVILMLFIITPAIKEHLKNILLTLVLVITVFNIYYTGLDYTIIDGPQNASRWRRSITYNTDNLKNVLEEGDRVYLVYKDQDGLTYIRYKYNLLPALTSVDDKSTGIDFSINFREKIDYTSDRQYYNVASPKKFTEVMRTYFDYIYVVEPDEEFYNTYGHLFSDGMVPGVLYKITDNNTPMQEVVV